mgnify:CR=1 FL=1
MKPFAIAPLVVALVSAPAFAQVSVKDPWVRATVPAQKATAAFMQLTSPADTRLISASSPVAGAVESQGPSRR